LKGRSFTFRKAFVRKTFIIDECKIYGGGFEKLIIRINFSGTNDGVVYLTGKPVYKPDIRSIEIEDIDFDIKSKNILLGSADWLFDKKITREISKYAKFELGPYIDSAKLNINEKLNMEWKKGITGSGNINEIKLMGIYPMQQFLVIRSNCEGTLSVKIDSVDISL
jgi:hypothetical protein